jgi:hypothetical protein
LTTQKALMLDAQMCRYRLKTHSVVAAVVVLVVGWRRLTTGWPAVGLRLAWRGVAWRGGVGWGGQENSDTAVTDLGRSSSQYFEEATAVNGCPKAHFSGF